VKLAIVQPNFFPYKAYYDLAQRVDKFIFLDDFNYSAKNWVNKTIIKLNSSKFYFRVPVDYKENTATLTKNVKVKGDQWKKKFLKFTKTQYRNYPNFNLVFPILKEVIDLPSENICDISAYSVFRICDELGCKTEFTISSVKHGCVKKSYHDKIFEICQREKASTYYTFSRHRGEFDEKKFLRANIRVSYFASYADNYSIIDSLMSDDNLF